MLDHAYFILEIPQEKEADKEKRLEKEQQQQENGDDESVSDDDEEEDTSSSKEEEDEKDCELKGEPFITRVLSPRLFEAGTHNLYPLDFEATYRQNCYP